MPGNDYLYIWGGGNEASVQTAKDIHQVAEFVVQSLFVHLAGNNC